MNEQEKKIGIFSTQDDAIRAIKRLKINGYKDDEISVLAKEHEDIDRVSKTTDTDVKTTDAQEGAAGGTVAGGVLGGLGALLVELGVIAIPGVGPFLAAGPVVAVITGAVTGGALGGLVGALIDMGLTKEEAEEFEDYLDRGYILVMVEGYKDRGVYDNFYENNSIIRDRYKREFLENHEEEDLNKFVDPTDGNRVVQPDNPGRPVDPKNPDEPIDPVKPQ